MKYMIDVAMGMHYISEKGLVHRVRFLLKWTMLIKKVNYVHVNICCGVEEWTKFSVPFGLLLTELLFNSLLFPLRT